MSNVNPLVRELQLHLNDRGAKLTVDGIYGPGTHRENMARLPAPAVAPPPPAPSAASGPVTALTPRIALEIVGHEAIVPEAYKDSVGVWTWGVGVTSKSGHSVERYKDNPQPLRRCLEIYIWLLRERYLPPVLEAFAGFPLSEAQLAAALSFHYNTGAIAKASWVGLAKAGRIEEAKASFMQWRKPPEIVKRRQAECDLFFEGRWSQDGKALVIPVAKPSYAPSFRRAARVDIRADVEALLSAEGAG